MYQYRWNRKYRWKPEVFVNCNFWLHIRRKYAIYISFDSKFYFWFDEVKIFEIRPRNFFKSAFFQNAWAEFKFRLQIRIQRKISRRMFRCIIESAFVLWLFSLKLALNAHAVIFSMPFTGIINMDHKLSISHSPRPLAAGPIRNSEKEPFLSMSRNCFLDYL